MMQRRCVWTFAWLLTTAACSKTPGADGTLELGELEEGVGLLASFGDELFHASDGGVVRARRADGRVETVATAAAPVQQLVVVEQGIVWATEHAVWTTARAGGEPRKLVDGRARELLGVGDGVIVRDEQGLLRVDLPDGRPTRLGAPKVDALAWDGGEVLGRDADTGRVVAIPVDGASARELGTTRPGRGVLGVDDQHVYSCAGGALERLPLRGGATELLTERCTAARMVVDDGQVTIGAQGASGVGAASADLRRFEVGTEGWVVVDRGTRVAGPVRYDRGVAWGMARSGEPGRLRWLAPQR